MRPQRQLSMQSCESWCPSSSCTQGRRMSCLLGTRPHGSVASIQTALNYVYEFAEPSARSFTKQQYSSSVS